MQEDSMQEEGDTAGRGWDKDQGGEVDNTSAFSLQITCVSRHNREDLAKDAATAVLYPQPQVTAWSHHQHNVRTSQASLKTLPTGTCATHVALTSKMGTGPSHAPQRGADPTTQKNSPGLMQTNTSIKGGICAPN